MLGEFEQARADHETIVQIADAASQHRVLWRASVDLGKLWASRDYNQSCDYFERALEVARQIGDPAVLAGSLNWMGNWHANAEDPLRAVQYHQEALEIVERLGNRQELADTLDLLGITSLLGGDLTAAVQYYDQAILLFRELGDQPSLASSLTGRGHASGATFPGLTQVAPDMPVDPRRDFEEAMRISQEVGSLSGEAWVAWSLGQLEIVQGCYGQALEVMQRGLCIASQIGHCEWIVGNQCALGQLYVELLAPERARLHLEAALTLAEELRSRVWIHLATGALAVAHSLLDALVGAQACLESVLSAETPVDTQGQRYCWGRQAELALCRGDPEQALDIVERLIASAPGLTPGRVITFLWKLKGEALSAMGQMDQAHTLLQEAIENAQAAGERSLLWRLHTSMGRLYRAMDRQPESEVELSRARERVEELADTLPCGELRDNFLQRAYDIVSSSP
jgi:tetratricopeptide (TPR) repeat protein